MVSFVKLLSFMSLEMYIETFFLVFQRILSSQLLYLILKKSFFLVIQVFLGLTGSSKIQHKLNYNDVKRFFWAKTSFKYELGQKIKLNYAGLETSAKSIQKNCTKYRLYKAKCLPILKIGFSHALLL